MSKLPDSKALAALIAMSAKAQIDCVPTMDADRDGLALAIGNGAATVLAVLDEDEGMPLTAAEVFIAQFDAAAIAGCSTTLRERDRPGAITALRQWAETRGLVVARFDLRPSASCVCHEVTIASLHTITVNEYVGPEVVA